MSLRLALVGLLAEEPMSGYDLTKRFELTLANTWSAQHSQIYPELRKLVDEGLIVQTGDGPRGRKVYAATTAGLDAVRAWVTDGQTDHGVRNEGLLRSFFLWLLRPEEAARYLRAESEHWAGMRSRLEGCAPSTSSCRLVIEAGHRYYRMMEEWATWAADEVEAGALEPAG
ncbi:MAG: PadR family transcriptional regulator [Acidimicrobiales bacterium]